MATQLVLSFVMSCASGDVAVESLWAFFWLDTISCYHRILETYSRLGDSEMLICGCLSSISVVGGVSKLFESNAKYEWKTVCCGDTIWGEGLKTRLSKPSVP